MHAAKPSPGLSRDRPSRLVAERCPWVEWIAINPIQPETPLLTPMIPTRLDADSSSVKAGSIQAGWYRATGWPAAARQK
jgi:hypothetical protein